MGEINPQIIITAKDEASAVLNKFSGNAASVGSNINNTLKENIVGLGGAFAATSGFIASSIGAFTESEDAIAQLDATLKANADDVSITKDEVLKLAAALQQQSKFSDEAVIGAQNLLIPFTRIQKEVFPDVVKLSLDIAQKFGRDLPTVSIQLGKALNDPAEALSSLTRIGVRFNEQQQEQVKLMVEAGDVGGAQRFILDELSKYEGAAAAAAKTHSGQLEILKNNLNDVQETIGQQLLQALVDGFGGIENITKAVKNFNDFLVNHKDVLLGITLALVALALVFGGLFLAAIIAVTGASLGFIAAIGAIAIGVGFAAGIIIANFGKIRDFVIFVLDGIVNFAKAVIDIIGGAFQSLFTLMDSLMMAIVEGLLFITRPFVDTANAFKNTFIAAIDSVKQAWNGFLALFNGEAAGKFMAGLPIPRFATGGVVQGAIGTPQLAIVHGGEEIKPHGASSQGMGGGGTTLNVHVGMYAGSVTEKRNIAESLYKELVVLARSKNKTVQEYLGA